MTTENKIVTLIMEMPEGADYPDIRLNSEVFGGRIYFMAAFDLYKENEKLTELLDRAADILSLSDHEDAEALMAEIEPTLGNV